MTKRECVDMDQVFGTIKAAIDGSGLSLGEITRLSGIATPTLRQWLNGTSQGMRVDGLLRLMAVTGWRVVIERKGGRE